MRRRKAGLTKVGTWIRGAGFDQTKFTENRLPTKHDLDKISTAHPIVIRRCCLHTIVANSTAMELAGVGPETIKRFKGLIEVDDNGNPTGIFREKSTIIFDEIIPDALSDPQEKKKIILSVMNDMVSKGITSITTYAAKIWNYEENIAFYKELEREGLLPLRVIVCLDDINESINANETPKSKTPHDKVKFGSYKLFTDGSLGARSAALLEPYSDDAENSGILADQAVLFQDLLAAWEKGLQPAIHAIGDRALEATLNAIEAVLAKAGPAWNSEGRLPFRIIHAQLVNPGQLDRLKKLPVILDIQPVFLCTDLYWIESRLGRERLKNAYIWKTLNDAGLMLTGGSDCPVESFDPVKGIYAAATRQDINGFPEGGFRPEERLSAYEALCLFTKNIAYATGDEYVLGTIEEGKFADLAVLDRDPLKISPDGLKDIKVLKTFVAGEKVYEYMI